MSDDNHSSAKESAWYPRHASGRADELVDELDAAQTKQLFNALKSKTLSEWFVWLEEARAEIGKYDYLSRAERKRRLQAPSSSEALLLHHACAYIELWRARTARSYFHFPPSGSPINTAEVQREMMLAVLASYNDFDVRDLWPFDMPDGESDLPFRNSSD